MRKFLMVFAAAALVSPCTFASPPPTVNIAATDGGAVASSNEKLGEIAGDYALSNGRKVRLTAAGDRLYVDLKRGYSSELQPVGENAFASRDGSIRVTFKPQESGGQIVLDYDANWHKAPIGINALSR